MFKIGDLVTKEQFIKYAPYGMELKHGSADVVLRYDMKAYENFCSSGDIENWDAVIPGFMYCGFSSPDPMNGVWEALEDDIEKYNINENLYRIHKLPILKLLKRKQIC